MAVIPTLLVLALVWLPALGSVLLSFTNWNGIGPLNQIEGIGFTNYVDIATNYPPFWPAIRHNLTVARLPLLHRHAARDVPRGAARQGDAVQPLLPDRVLPAGRAVAGPHRLHLAADLLPRPGPDQRGLGTQIDWYGDPNVNLWAVAGRHRLAAHRLHHAALPGRAEGVDPSLREAARSTAPPRRDLLPGRLPGDAADQHHRPGRHRDRVAARLRPGLGDQQGPQRAGADRGAGHARTSSARPAGSASARRWRRSCC